MSTYPFICKICGKQSDETILDCDADDFCICRKGFGCNNQKESEQTIVFRKIYSTLIESGNICYPRGLKTKEIENFSFILPPFTRFVNFEDRKLKLSYIKREFIWYLKGDKFDTSIAKYAKMWKDFINEDGSINSNYGQYIFGNLNQFNYVFDCLLKDKDSRRAIIIILQPYHILNLKMKEVPCTYNLSFRIRKNKLNMSVKMRSQDAWFGFGSDIPCFSFIHEMLFVLLKEKYVNLQLGNYHHFVDSFHVYSQHFDLIEKISNDSIFHNIECPKINSADEVRFLLKCNFKNIPNNFEFTKWLTNLD